MSITREFLAALSCPHPKAVAERLGKGLKSDVRPRSWAWRSELEPADLYCYLWARFGPPNGMQNFLRSNSSDNLVHWEWALDHPLGHIHIQGMNFRTELWLLGDLNLDDSDKVAFAELIKGDFAVHGKRMSEIRKSLEHWVEFVNPYMRLRKAVEKLLVDLRALRLEPEVQKIPDATGPDDFEEQGRNWAELSDRYSRGLGICFGIRSMLPVMAEAYINFLMFVLMRPELKVDQRLRDNAFRQPIDIRVKTLHLTCEGFANPVNYASAECKAYHTLVNERNDMLHGNVVLEKLQFNDVYFKGTVPVFKTYRTLWERTVGVEVEAVGLHRLENEVASANSFIAYLGSCLRPEVRKHVEYMAETRDLGWNEKEGRVGVLFPPHLVDMFSGEDSRPTGTESSGTKNAI